MNISLSIAQVIYCKIEGPGLHANLFFLNCYVFKQMSPEERIPDVKAEFSAVIFDWTKTTAAEKMQARRGKFPL